jgi:hypothetical protein
MRPVFFPRAQLRMTAPVDWTETKTDQPNGLVATYTDPKDALRQIIVRCQVVPKNALNDDAKRDALVTRMIDAERRLPPFKPGAAPTGEQPATVTGTYLRALAATAARPEQPLKVVTRYFIIKDVLVSVRSVAGEGDEGIDKITDTFVAAVKPLH